MGKPAEKGARDRLHIVSAMIRDFPRNSAVTHVVREMLRHAAGKTLNIEGNSNRHHVRFASVDALPFLHVSKGGGVVADHCIPLSILVREVLAKNIHDVDALLVLTKKYSTMALITTVENNRLSDHGLATHMPEGWDGVDLLARYTQLGIEVHTV